MRRIDGYGHQKNRRINMEYRAGPDNTKFMQSLLRERLPGFSEVVKKCYQSGLIEGLRGLTIVVDEPEVDASEAIPKNPAKFCRQCEFFERDKVGDGSGLGNCLKRVERSLLPWPNQAACHLFRGINDVNV